MSILRFVVALLFVVCTASSAVAQTNIDVVTYNAKRADPWLIMGDIAALSPRPPIIALQEADGADMESYKAALAQAYPGTTWTGAFQGYNCSKWWPCYAQGGGYNPANDDTAQGVAVLTMLPASYQQRMFMTKDEWWLGRGAVHARVTVPGIGEINVFSGHAPIADYPAAQAQYLAEIKAWAQSMSGPRFMGIDANVNPAQALYPDLVSGGWVDAWADATGSTAGGQTKTYRIDYWLSHSDSSPSPINAEQAVVGPWGNSDHRPFYVLYSIGGSTPPPPPPPSGWSISDDFNDGQISTAMWVVGDLFSGTETPAVVVTETTNLRITLVENGPGVQYNGVATIGTRDFRGAQASVELVTAPNSAADAYAMLTVGTDSAHFYRWYVKGGELHAQKNVGGPEGKVPVGSALAYSSSTHRYVRIRHDGGTQVVFETSADGTNWVPRHSETWSTAIPLDLKFELKGGTSAGQFSPGIVEWDNFAAGTTTTTPPPQETVLVEDAFDAPALNTSLWTNTLITPAQSTAITTAIQGSGLRVGPLPQNATATAYNGIASVNAYSLADGGSAWVRIDEVPTLSDQGAQVMFTVAADVSNFYRMYLYQGELRFEKKVAGEKTQFPGVPYAGTTTHAFWRIKHHVTDNRIVFEVAAPNANGQPDGWTEVGRDTAPPMALTNLFLEFKGGVAITSGANPGYTRMAHIKAVR